MGEGLDEYHEPLAEMGAEMLSDLADVTDASFAASGLAVDKGRWLRQQAQAVRAEDGDEAVPPRPSIPEGVPKEEDDGV